MSIKRSGCVVLMLASLVFSSVIHAAELRGRFANGSGATVRVSCSGGGGGAATVNDSGKYTVRGLPAGRNCNFVVSRGSASSVPIAFSTAQSITVYSGRLTVYGNRIVVVQQ
jgi:hypothetical protein